MNNSDKAFDLSLLYAEKKRQVTKELVTDGCHISKAHQLAGNIMQDRYPNVKQFLNNN